MDHAKVDQAIQLSNARLGQMKAPKVERRGDWLWVRGTFPAKPHLRHLHPKPYQQHHRLGLPADPKFVQEAERLAQLMGAELSLGRFDWGDYCEECKTPQTVADWIQQFEQNYWQVRSRSPSAQNTLKIYQRVFKHLPPEGVLTLNLIIEKIGHWEPNTRGRQIACNCMAQLAGLAGLSELPIRVLAGNYSPKAVQPKDLPSDEEIAAQYKRIEATALRWLFGVMAAYGLRPHEPFHLDLKDFPKIRVGEHTKTGYRRRVVRPLYPEWAEEWRLWERSLPDFAELNNPEDESIKQPEDYNNSKLTNRVSNRFRRRKIGFSPIYLRHAYAARNFRCGFSTAYGAKQMGHSVKVHETIYQAWVSEGIYDEIYDKQMKGDRPRAPL